MEARVTYPKESGSPWRVPPRGTSCSQPEGQPRGLVLGSLGMHQASCKHSYFFDSFGSSFGLVILGYLVPVLL